MVFFIFRSRSLWRRPSSCPSSFCPLIISFLPLPSFYQISFSGRALGEDDMETEEAATSAVPKVYCPGMEHELKEGEELVYDPSAYLM